MNLSRTRLTPKDRTFLHLAHQREFGILTEPQLLNILAEQHNITPTRFWQHINRLRHNINARAEYPALTAHLDRRVEARKQRGAA